MPRPINELAGKRFHHLVVIKRAPQKLYGHIAWICRCDCGMIKIIQGCHLTTNHTKSCGCAHLKNQLWSDSKKKYCSDDILTKYKYDAEIRNHIFNLPSSLFKDLITQRCHYCGRLPAEAKSRTGFNGIDRKDPFKDYVPANCVPCCKDCNYGKFQMTEGEFHDWIYLVYRHIYG